MTFTHALGTNNYGPAKFIVATSAANGTHTTLASAMSAASAGDTIYLRDSVTENITITPGVNITSFVGNELTPNVSITGKITMSGAGTSTISGIRLTTNSDFSVVISGSNACILFLDNCYINCLNNTGISFTNSNAASKIIINNCRGNLATTGIGFFSSSSAGVINIFFSQFDNTGGSTTSSTLSSGGLQCFYCFFASPITNSSTATLGFDYSTINSAAQNTTCLTVGGSGSCSSSYSYYLSGTASAISISSSLNLEFCTISSSNTNAITGVGTIIYGVLYFVSTSKKINTTTQTGGTIQGGLTQTPSVGFLGETIVSFVPIASQITLSSPTAQNITSINLTAGIWDVSAIAFLQSSGASTTFSIAITTVSGTLPGNSSIGDNQATFNQTNSTATAPTLSIPSYRMTLSGTTTVYLVGQATFSTGSGFANGRISATRVG